MTLAIWLHRGFTVKVIVHNFLGPLKDCLERWEKPPRLAEFAEDYYRHIAPWVGGAFFIEGAESLHSEIADLNWPLYRKETLELDPAKEEERVKRHLHDVEELFGFELQGDIILFGAFTLMDGFARFDRGSHRVFLGVDESHGRGAYLDVLTTHELTHVARESRPEVWQGWGLDPRMSRHDFGEFQPVIEHVFGEGFSCAVSELLVPGEDPWQYAYQTKDSLALALTHGPAIGRRIREEILKPHAKSDYTRLYDPGEYGARVPPFSQYVWGWQWTKRLLRERAGGDPRKLVSVCSKDFMESAKTFELSALEPAFPRRR